MPILTTVELDQQAYDWKVTLLATMRDNYVGLLNGGVQQYTLNTGQTTQTVTKINAFLLLREINRLEAELRDMSNRLLGATGTVIVKPGF